MAPAPLLALLAAAVEVTGVAGCPEPAQVAASLQMMMSPEGPSQVPADRASLAPTPDGRAMHVELRRADGTLLASRQVATSTSCAETAEFIAVVIASWEARFRSGLQGPLEMDLRPPPAPIRPRLVEVGAAGLASLQNRNLASGAVLEMAVSIADGRLALRVAPMAVWGHQLALPPGTASWARAGTAAGVRLRLAHGRIFSDLMVDLLATALRTSGSGFATDRASFSFDPGAQVGLRLGVLLGRVEPWIGATLVVWARRQFLQVQGVTGGIAELSRLEPLLALGLSLRFGG